MEKLFVHEGSFDQYSSMVARILPIFSTIITDKKRKKIVNASVLDNTYIYIYVYYVHRTKYEHAACNFRMRANQIQITGIVTHYGRITVIRSEIGLITRGTKYMCIGGRRRPCRKSSLNRR